MYSLKRYREKLISDGKIFAQGKCKDLLYDKDLMDEGGVEAI